MNLKNIFKTVPLTAIFIFLVTYLVFTLHDNYSYTTDTLSNNYTAVNIIYNHKLSLDNLSAVLINKGLIDVATKNKQNQYYSRTPILNGILSVPFFYVFDKINGITFNNDLLFNEYYQIVGKYYGSLLISITSSILFLLLFKIFKNYKLSLTCTFIYSFCTFTYGTSSQGNWQHAPSSILYIVSLIYFYKYLKHFKLTDITTSTILIFISYIIRPLNVIFFIAQTIILIINKKFKHSILSVIVFIFFYLSYTFITKIIGIPDGYQSAIIDSLRTINPIYSFKVLFNLIFSPNYGLLVFYPVFILSFVGIILFILKYKQTPLNPQKYILIYSLLIICAVFFLNSIWIYWPGGYSWGPRLLSEATIPMIFYIYYFLSKFNKNKVVFISTIILTIYSLSINIIGIYANNTEWNVLYMKDPTNYLYSAWSKPYIIPFYLKQKRSLYTKVLKTNTEGEKYLEQKTYLIDYKNKKLVKVFDIIQPIN